MFRKIYLHDIKVALFFLFLLFPLVGLTQSSFEAVIGKVDVDKNQEYAAKYGVRNIPTVLVFKNGEVVKRQVGVATKEIYAKAIDSLL